MPPLGLANHMWLGRHHPLFREATLAERMLASSARLLMRQLMLGRGAGEEVHKALTGSTMLIAQPSATYEQVLPSMEALSDGLVVLFCKSIDDVSKAQALVVKREVYLALVELRKRVCPVFQEVKIDQGAVARLPESGVPDALLQNAHAMPEASSIRTTLQGPGNRNPIFSRQEPESDPESSGDDTPANSGEPPPAATVGSAAGSGEPPPAAASGDASDDAEPLQSEELNEHEAVIGIDDQCCPEPLRNFEAWSATTEARRKEAENTNLE